MDTFKIIFMLQCEKSKKGEQMNKVVFPIYGGGLELLKNFFNLYPSFLFIFKGT